jgi:hypothetical protein
MSNEQIGAAAISIDVTALRASGRRGSPRQEALVARLLAMFDELDTAATWAIAEPADSEATAQILGAKAPHEIAVLGDAGWIGEAAGRPAFACNLARRTITAQAAGLSVRVLACRNACVPRAEYDLLVKHNIAVVRQPRSPSARSIASFQPEPLRHGIWEIPATVEIPQANAWFGAGAGAAKGALARAAAQRAAAHVAIDLASLAACDSRLHAVRAVLQAVAQGRQRGVLEVMTLGALSEKLSRPKQAVFARSILHAA